ncbi:MAG: fibronectin type III-like domain-contianing protein, partial [Clostridia bacterium]|nr:fibronectin type III-like domain-contianing protein [Clostridia bacterium]
MPDFTDYSLHNRTYRYYTGTPLYPFGYGLTYGDVAATDLYANTEGAYVTVENRGQATEDVIQLYIRDQKSPFAPENPILCGFQRIFLDSGEVKQFYVPIDSEALTKKAAKTALGKLGGDVAPTGQYNVVFDPEAMSDLLATFCSIFSAENAQKGL